MDTSLKYQCQKVCKEHNMPFVLFDQQQKQPLCFICVKEKTGMVQIYQTSQQLDEIENQSNKEFQKELQQLQQLWDSILQYKENLIVNIDIIIQIIIDQIEQIRLSQKNFEQQFQSSNLQNTFDQFNNELKQQQDNHNKFKIQIIQLLFGFQQKCINIDCINLIFSESAEIEVKQVNRNSKMDQIIICEVIQEKMHNLEKFQYELIPQSGMKQKEYCFAMSFNKDNTNLIVGCDSQIKIYEFVNGHIGKELQVLSNHKKYVNCFYIMKQSDCFISGSKDKSIIIWKQDKKSKWLSQQILKDHQEPVNCLLMNKNENLLISGSEDTTVKFWNKNNDRWTRYQIIETDKDYQVFAMSFNEQESKLIICGIYPKIYVIESQNDKKWKITQNIKVDELGYRLCFTIKDQFVFQPYSKNYLEVYDYDSKSNQFFKKSQVQIQKCDNCYISFPCQYIKQLNIIFVRHGGFLNIFKINKDCNYQLIQTIRVEVQFNLYGTVSDDGKFLITWDEDSNKIQVRKQQLLNE